MEKVNVIEGVTLIKSGFYLPPFCLSSYSRLLYCVCKMYLTQVEMCGEASVEKKVKKDVSEFETPFVQ